MAKGKLFVAYVSVVKANGEVHEVVDYDPNNSPPIKLLPALRPHTFRTFLGDMGIPDADVDTILRNSDDHVGPVPDHNNIIISTCQNGSNTGVLHVFVNQPNARSIQFEVGYARGKTNLKRLLDED